MANAAADSETRSLRVGAVTGTTSTGTGRSTAGLRLERKVFGDLDRFVLVPEAQGFVCPPSDIKQEFVERESLASVPDEDCDPSVIVAADEFNRSYIGVTVGSNLPDTVAMEYSDALADPGTHNILKFYNPCHPKWASDFRRTFSIENHTLLSNFRSDDRQILFRYSKLSVKYFVEPLFLSVTAFAFVGDNFERISETCYIDITPPNIREAYKFFYNYDSDFHGSIGESAANDGPSSSLPSYQFAIPLDVQHDNVFFVVQISKILTGTVEKALALYERGAKWQTGDLDRHVESCERLQEYRQPLAVTFVKLLDSQYRTSFNGSISFALPLFAQRQSLNDLQLGQLVRDVYPLGRSTTVPSPTAKMDVLEGEIKLQISEVSPPLGDGSRSDSSPAPGHRRMGSKQFGSMDRAMILDQSPAGSRNNFVTQIPQPLVAQGALRVRQFSPSLLRSSSEVTRQIFMTPENSIYVYPLIFENFQQRNLCLKVELIEFDTDVDHPERPYDVKANWHRLPAVYSHLNPSLFQLEALTVVSYHSKAPDVNDEIKIRLPDRLCSRHFLRFTALHIHVKPRSSKKGSAGLLGMLGGSRQQDNDKETESSYFEIGMALLPLITGGVHGIAMAKEGAYDIFIAEIEPSQSSPKIRIGIKPFFSSVSCCEKVQKCLLSLPPALGVLPSSALPHGIIQSLSRRIKLRSAKLGEETLTKFVTDLGWNAQSDEVKRFFLVLIRYLYRTMIFGSAQADRSTYSNPFLLTPLRCASFITMLRVFGHISAAPGQSESSAGQKDETSQGLGEKLLFGYVDLLFDEELPSNKKCRDGSWDSDLYRPYSSRVRDDSEDRNSGSDIPNRSSPPSKSQSPLTAAPSSSQLPPIKKSRDWGSFATETVKQSGILVPLSAVIDGDKFKFEDNETMLLCYKESEKYLDEIFEHLICQCERQVHVILILDAVSSVDLSAVPLVPPHEVLRYNAENILNGSSRIGKNAHELLPRPCLRWWSSYLCQTPTAFSSTQNEDKDGVANSIAFDMERTWFNRLEQGLPGKVVDYYSGALYDEDGALADNLFPLTSTRADHLQKANQESLGGTNVSVLPYYPRPDTFLSYSERVDPEDISEGNSMMWWPWFYELQTTNWAALLLAIKERINGVSSSNSGANSSSGTSKSSSSSRVSSSKEFTHIVDYQPYIAFLQLLELSNVKDLEKCLADKSPVLFHFIWKSLMLRIVREHKAFPIELDREYLQVLSLLLSLIIQQIGNHASLGYWRSSRLNLALGNFMMALFPVLIHSQLAFLLSTCTDAYNELKRKNDTSDFKLHFLRLISQSDYFVPLNCVYAHDTPLELLKCRNLRKTSNMLANEITSNEKAVSVAAFAALNQQLFQGRTLPLDKYALVHAFSTIRYFGESVMNESPLLPGWLADLFITEIITVYLTTESNTQKAVLKTLRSMIVRHCYDSRYGQSRVALQRIAVLYIPLLNIFVADAKSLCQLSHESARRKEVLVIVAFMLQCLSTNGLRSIIQDWCQDDDRGIFPKNLPTHSSAVTSGVKGASLFGGISSGSVSANNSGGLRSLKQLEPKDPYSTSKIFALMRILHLILDSFEFPYGTSSFVDAERPEAMFKILNQLLVPSIYAAVPGNIDETTGRSMASTQEVYAALEQQLKFRKTRAETGIVTPNKTPDRETKRLFGGPRSTAAPRPLVAYEGHSPSTASIVRSKPYSQLDASVAQYSAQEVSRMSANIVLYTLQLLLEECPQLLMGQTISQQHRTSGSPRAQHNHTDISSSSSLRAMASVQDVELGDEESSDLGQESVLNFTSMAATILLHSIVVLKPTGDVVGAIDSAKWMLSNMGYPLFFSGVGETMQDWIHECLHCAFHEMDSVREASCTFIVELFYSCFLQSGSLRNLAIVFLPIFQIFMTSTLLLSPNKTPNSEEARASWRSYRKTAQAKFEKFTKHIKEAVDSFFAIDSSLLSTFRTSFMRLLSDAELLFGAHVALTSIVVSYVPFSHDGANMLDGPFPASYSEQLRKRALIEVPSNSSLTVTTSASFDQFPATSDESPKFKVRATCDDVLVALHKAASVFNPCQLPKYHIFWLENMALMHDLMGNIAEGAEVRMKVYYVCRSVESFRATLWSPRPVIQWSARGTEASPKSAALSPGSPSSSASSNRDYFDTLYRTVRNSKVMAWSTARQYYEHIETLLTKAGTMFSSAGLLRSAEKASALLVNHYRSQGKIEKISDEYLRLGSIIKQTKEQGLEMFSLGCFYRVYFTGLGVPLKWREREFIYRDATNSHIFEFQAFVRSMIASMLTEGYDSSSSILVTSDNSLSLPEMASEKKAIAIIGAVKPLLVKDKTVGCVNDEFCCPNAFHYEVPFTLDGKKSHSQRIDEQYKRRVSLYVKETFPTVFVRQAVYRREVQVLTPIEVAAEDIEERILEMTRMLGKQGSYDQADLRDVMRVVQGSILPQVNAGAAEVAKVFLVDIDHNDDKIELGPLQKKLKRALITFLQRAHALLLEAEKGINLQYPSSGDAATTNAGNSSSGGSGNGNSNNSSGSINTAGVTAGMDSRATYTQWVEEMKKAHTLLVETLKPYIGSKRDNKSGDSVSRHSRSLRFRSK